MEVPKEVGKPVELHFKCPVCKSDKRVAGELAEKTKKDGWMRPNVNFYTQTVTVIVSDNTLENRRPYGSKVIAYNAYMDICSNCGCYYAVKVVIKLGTKSLPMGGKTKPGEGQFSFN